jgi:hypothetical protein
MTLSCSYFWCLDDDGYYTLTNLCKQDKATLEMESMEDGILGKILVGDGAKDIPVGQVYFSS